MMICKRPLTLASPVLLLAFTGGCDDGLTRVEQLEFAEPIEHIEVETGSGEILVVADPEREHIEVEAVIHGAATQLRWDLDDGTLHLAHECALGSGLCTVDWYLWVPEASEQYLNLELESGSGDITIDRVRGNVRATTGSGNVTLRDTIGFVIELEAGSGDLLLARNEADAITATTGSGEVEVALLSSPRRVALETGSGDVQLTVPGDGYRLALETGSGNIDVHGLAHDPDGESLISILTGSGDVVVHGR